MRSLLAPIAVTCVLILGASHSLAQVGTDPDGKSFVSTNDKYLMCGKCAWTPDSAVGATWYKLVCDGPQGTPDSYSWIDWDCDTGCSTCRQSTNVTMTAVVPAYFASGTVYTNVSASQASSNTTITGSVGGAIGSVATSFQCCPKVVVTTNFSNSECTMGTDRLDYAPSGCTGTGKSWFGSFCETAGTPPSPLYNGCFATADLSTGDACPVETSTCLASFNKVTNTPCLTLNDLPGLGGSIAIDCLVDTAQVCLRLVRSEVYTSSLSPSGGLAGLSCIGTPAPPATNSSGNGTFDSLADSGATSALGVIPALLVLLAIGLF